MGQGFFIKEGEVWVADYTITKSPVTGADVHFLVHGSERKATEDEKQRFVMEARRS